MYERASWRNVAVWILECVDESLACLPLLDHPILCERPRWLRCIHGHGSCFENTVRQVPYVAHHHFSTMGQTVRSSYVALKMGETF